MSELPACFADMDAGEPVRANHSLPAARKGPQSSRPLRPLWRTFSLLLSLCFGILSAPAAHAQPPQLPTLTTCHAAHHLTVAEADRHYPVHLRAVVSFYEVESEKADPTLFVLDETGSIYVSLARMPSEPLAPGDLVELNGISSGGQYAPIVAEASVQFIRHGSLPASAPRVGIGDMLSGAMDGQWVEIEAVVHSVKMEGGEVILNLAMHGGAIVAGAPAEPGVDYSKLIDAEILIRGNAAPLFNHQHQVTGGDLNFPGMISVRIERPAVQQPFALPVTPIMNLLRYTPDLSFPHRVHVRGQVTLFWPGRLLCVRDDGDSVCAEVAQATPLRMGDSVDVIGFPMTGDFSPNLVFASFQRAGPGFPVQPQAIDFQKALNDESDGELVSIDARVIATDTADSDPTIILSVDDKVFSAVIARGRGMRFTRPEVGSRVRVTGICSIQSDGAADPAREGFPQGKGFRLLLNSPSDIVVLQKPSWWNARHTLWVLTLAFVLALAALVLVARLSLRVRQQSELIRDQLLQTAALKDAAESATVAAQFHAAHDELTGIRNRRTIFADFQREFDLAARSGHTLGVIMVDLDHFKNVNDTYGHLVGDEVLRETVRRITSALRQSDLVGRYGGEEFMVVLPQCDKHQLQACAERIRCAIACGPMMIGDLSIPMTTSVGTAITMSPPHAMLDALAAADSALYQAKHGGRNRVVLKDLATGAFEELLSNVA